MVGWVILLSFLSYFLKLVCYAHVFPCTCTCGFESHPRQLIFLRKSDCLGCAVLLCLVVCMTLLASFFLPSSLIKNVHVHLISHLKTCMFCFEFVLCHYIQCTCTCTCTCFLMRDEKEGRKKQARSNKQTRQSNTVHPTHVHVHDD